MKELLRDIVYFIYKNLPKYDWVVLYGYPDFEDNCLALEKELRSRNFKKVIYFVSKFPKKALFQFGNNVRIVKKNSLKGIFYFLFSKYLFFTHRCFMRKFPDNVVSVNLWHGLPIKKLGWMLNNNEGIESKYVVATSDFWAEIMTKAMRPQNPALKTGLPRNDRLFMTGIRVRNLMGLQERNDIQKIIAWLPTYRKSVRGEIRTDGKDSGNVFGLPDAGEQDLNAFFKEHHLFAFLKPHPLAKTVGVKKFSNLLIIDDNWLKENGVSLYEMVGQADALISDISGMVVDYLLLNRPIIHCFPDIAEYRNSRGFSFEPVEDYFVGPCVQNVDELKKALFEIADGRDPYASQRAKIRSLWHDHLDSKSSDRLLEVIGL